MNHRHGYCRVATAVPVVRPGAVEDNVNSILRSLAQVEATGADLLVFPELCITGYTCGDLFYQEALLDSALKGLERILRESCRSTILLIVGMPLRVNGLLMNCAVVCRKGQIKGVVPKSNLPNSGEFYERRWFSSGAALHNAQVSIFSTEVPVGGDLIFHYSSLLEAGIGVELCEDLWSVTPPSCALATQGAIVICNLSASNELVGKLAYRHELVRQQSARCISAYLYCGAGVGESTTDLVFGGDMLIAENGRELGRGARFFRSETMLVKDVDLKLLAFERRCNPVFQQGRAASPAARFVDVGKLASNTIENREFVSLARSVDPYPFVPSDRRVRSEHCEEIFAIQSSGLATRLEHTDCDQVVIGLSGGLDSALALLVAVEAFERLGKNKNGIHAVTMPGPGTSERTLRNTRDLAAALGVNLEEIEITAACRQHLVDIGHDGIRHDVAFENTQARERTQILMNRANMLKALVIGTGDLSELALGWCTYNGDHMSMYGVNSGVPKTLVRYLISWAAECRVNQKAAAALSDILETPVSPELLPADREGAISQKTEEVIGPYELHDFFLHALVRCGHSTAKTRFLAKIAFKGIYPAATVDKWHTLFIKRFFAQQFKRSCMPDGPKVGTINLSPRGDWRMPSDCSDEPWC
jgi:NAD+ synthase (glutamine-hydrolysing)